MSEKYPVYRLTQDSYDQLQQAALRNPDLYLAPDADFDAVLRNQSVSDYLEDTGIRTNRPIELVPVETGAPNRADSQALDFYRSFEGMTPRLALDSRIWAWMTHFELHPYGLKRWRRSKSTNLANYVRSHWFSLWFN